jgi:hypothetical protein
MQMNNNLKKFTKAELINRINNDNKDQIESRSFFNKFKSYLSSFWTLLLKLKSLIGKLTLITFFLQLFRKYSIIRRIWQILNSIIVTIFGISFIDSFGFEFMNDFIIEIRIIIAKTVDYLTNTHFYIFLSKLFLDPSSENQSKPNKTGSMIRENSFETNTNETKIGQSNRNSKISEWLKPEDKREPEPEPEIGYGKYIIIGGILIIGSCFAYCYWNDIIGTTNDWYEFIKNYIRGDDPDLPPNRGGAREELDRIVREYRNRTNQEELPVYPENMEIPQIKVESPPLTSPSFDDLNSKIQESWGSSSTSSTETIKPIASTSNLKPVENPTSPIISESLKNNPFNTESNLFKDKLEDIKFWTTNWKSILPEETLEMIKFVENINKLPSNELTTSTEMSRVDMFAKIISEYNDKVKHFKVITSEKESEINKNLLFELRRWIRDNVLEIFPSTNETVKLGNPHDIPTNINLSEILN